MQQVLAAAESTTLPAPQERAGRVALFTACWLPSALAFNIAPSATVFNQLSALLAWGSVVALLATRGAAWRGAAPAPLLAAAVLLAAAAIGSWAAGTTSLGLAASAVGVIGAAALVAAGGATLGGAARRDAWMPVFFWGLLVAGLLGTVIGAVQVFLPQWPDGELIARSGLTGRAVGNVRQPNHLGAILLWALVATVPLVQTRRLPQVAGLALGAVLVFGVLLTGSRTAALGLVVLALWGGLDRRLAPGLRRALLAAPLWYALCWLAMQQWSDATQGAFGTAARFAQGDISSSRFGIWSNTLELIATQPWLGVGWGNFNFAWTLTPFPGRPVALFDHTHNLPLQLAVELGVPLAALVLALLALALWRAWRAGRDAAVPSDAVALRAAFVLLLVAALHSLLEYPLWYAHLLLPVAWAWGCTLAGDDRAPPSPRQSAALGVAGLLVAAGAVLALADYRRVAEIFAPGSDTPLAARIEDGKRSVFFDHHAHYAAATTGLTTDAEASSRRASHYLLDARLMMAWTRALERDGDVDAARTVAARLREFGLPDTAAFFERCHDAEPPAYCGAPERNLNWRELR